jgi:hypothetical protein
MDKQPSKLITDNPMPRTIAYIKDSADTQNLESQKLGILDYANRTGMRIDDFISMEISGRKTRGIDELFEKEVVLSTESSNGNGSCQQDLDSKRT